MQKTYATGIVFPSSVKKNGMCVDYTDLNKACPADPLLSLILIRLLMLRQVASV